MSISQGEREKMNIKSEVLQMEPKTYFDLIEKVGHSGKYQLRMLLIFLIMWFVTGIILLSTAFLFRSRSFDCKVHGLLVSESQCMNYVCKLPEDEWQSFYALDDNSFESLATDKEYLCDGSATVDIVSSFTYLGAFVGYIVISFFSDNFGRRSSILVSWGITTLGAIIVAVSVNIYMVAIGLFLCGCGSDAGINICFFFFGQVVGDEKRQKYSVFVQIFFCSGAIVITGFFYLIQSWRINWISLVLVLSIVQLVLLFFFVYETPQFLLKKGVNESLKVLNKIGKINMDLDNIIKESDIESVRFQQLADDYEDKYITPIDLCRFPSLRVITICCSIASFMTYAMYYGPALIIDEIGFNIYISNVMVNLSELVTFLPAYLFIDRIQRRKMGIILFLVCSVSALILTFIKKPEDVDISLEAVLELIVVFIFRACISFFFCFFQIYFCELYPARARGMGAGIVSAIGTLASTSSPIYLGYLKRNNINVMSIFVLFGIIGMSSLLLLTETKGVPLKEEIEEIQLDKEKKKTQILAKGSIRSIPKSKKSQITDEQKSGYSRPSKQN